MEGSSAYEPVGQQESVKETMLYLKRGVGSLRGCGPHPHGGFAC
jgi:hypothetical protein